MTQRTINFNRQTRLKWLQLLPLVTRRPLKPLLFALESFLGENVTCWPSVARLAQYVGTSERTTQRALAELERLGLITRTERRSALGRPSTFSYSLNWSLICDLASPNRGVTLPSGGVTKSQLRGDKLAVEGCQTDTLTYHKNQPKKHHTSASPAERPNGTDGVLKSGTGRTERTVSATQKVFGKPLRIEPAELDSADRVDELFRLAVASGAILDNEAARLKFFALARYCRRNPAINRPGAALAALVDARKWYGSDEDEGAARRAIARLTARRETARAREPTTGDLRVTGLFRMPDEVLAGVICEE